MMSLAVHHTYQGHISSSQAPSHLNLPTGLSSETSSKAAGSHHLLSRPGKVHRLHALDDLLNAGRVVP